MCSAAREEKIGVNSYIAAYTYIINNLKKVINYPEKLSTD